MDTVLEPPPENPVRSPSNSEEPGGQKPDEGVAAPQPGASAIPFPFKADQKPSKAFTVWTGEPKAILMRTGLTGGTAMSVPSGKLYILKYDWSISIVTAPDMMLNVQVVNDGYSIEQSDRNLFSSTQGNEDDTDQTTGQVPYVMIHTDTAVPNVGLPGGPNFQEAGAISGFDNYWFSDEMNRTTRVDSPVKGGFYVFTDSSGNEMGRARCKEVQDWADNPQSFLVI